MKKLSLSFVLLFLAEILQAYEMCKCDSISGSTYTVTQYYVEGGCCSGIAVQGAPSGSIGVYSQNEGETWLEESYTLVSNEFAQNSCCGSN